MRTVVLIWCLAIAACVGSQAPASGEQQATSTTCGGQLYDGCTSNDQCASGLCKLFSNRGVQVCTRACSASNPCPTQNGSAVVCNNMGFCRPDAPNACEVQ